jgi:hypothetical protein
MKPLKKAQKQLLFDYCLGINAEEETTKAEELIASRTEAVEIHTKLKDALKLLESVRPETCPASLLELFLL